MCHERYTLSPASGDAAGIRTADIAADVHKSADYVREHLDLLRLAEEVQELVGSGRVSVEKLVTH